MWTPRSTIIVAQWGIDCLHFSFESGPALKIKSAIRDGMPTIELHRSFQAPVAAKENEDIAISIDNATPVRWAPSAALRALTGQRLEKMYYNEISLYLYAAGPYTVECTPYIVRATEQTVLLCRLTEAD
jgi:hypothetical protein